MPLPELAPPSEDRTSTPAAHGPAVDAFVRRKILGALISLVALLGLVAVASIYFREELQAFTQWTFAEIGLGALAVLLFISDAVFSPIPPDAILFLVAKSHYHEHWVVIVPALGALSSVAGCVGYFAGRRLAHTRLSQVLFSRFKRKGTAIIHRYGAWGIALGALTPVPFSLTCWTAGMLEMPARRVVWPSLLRIPRFIVYYLAMAYAEDIVRGVF